MNTAATPGSAVATALSAAMTRHGVDPVAEPRRTVAVVADLTARPGASTASEVVALRAVLEALGTALDVETGSVDAPIVIEAATATGVSAAAARRVLDDVSSTLGLRFTGGDGRSRSFVVFTGAALAVVVIVALALVLWPGPDPEDQALDEVAPAPDTEATDGSTTTSTTEPPSTTTTAPAPATGLTATFAPVREGQFVVERGWRITPDQTELVGVVRLSSPEGETATGTHRELAPAVVGDGTALTWTPEPAERVNRVAVYTAVSIAADQVLELEFRGPLDADEPLSEADLLAWFDEWRPAAEELRSVLGEADELLEPLVEVEG